jgi:predicted RNA-binding protein
MCEARVFKYENNNEKKLMDDVYVLKREEDKVYLLNIFGEQEVVKAKVKEIDLVKHKIVIA